MLPGRLAAHPGRQPPTRDPPHSPSIPNLSSILAAVASRAASRAPPLPPLRALADGASDPAGASPAPAPAPAPAEVEADSSTPYVATAPYDPRFANSVYLVGRAGGDPDGRTFESGARVARFSLAVPRRGRDREPTTDWYQVECWNDLAGAVTRQVRRGARVCVHGALGIDGWTDRHGAARTTVTVRADALNLVAPEGDAAGAGAGPEEGGVGTAGAGGGAAGAGPSPDREAQWRSLVDEGTRGGWEDFRAAKAAGTAKPRHPDFKRGSDGAALWLEGSRDTPAWVADSDVARGGGLKE